MNIMTSAHTTHGDSVVITNNAREFHLLPGLAVETWTL